MALKFNAPKHNSKGGRVFTLVVQYDVSEDEYDIEGLDVPAWVAIGMLEYALVQVKRRDVENTLKARMENFPRVALPGGRH